MDAIEKVRAVLESVKEPCFGHTLKELHAVRMGLTSSGSEPSLEIRLGFPADASFIQALRKAVSQALDQAGLTAVDVPVRWEVLVHRVKLGLKPLEGVKNIIAVSSAKGGVGKSTVAVSLALALSRLGARVGLLDADVYGPSVPLLLDVHGKPSETDDQKMIPLTVGALQVNSIGFFVGESDSLAWRGPMASGAVRQLLEKTRWDRLDYLIVDMPPGTGDIPLTLVGGNISGTSDLAPLDEQAAMLHELFPDAKNVGLLYCSAEANSQYQVDTVKAALEEMGYTCEYYAFSDSNDLATITTNAATNSDVIYIPTDNTAAANTEIINNICQPAKVPVIAGEEGICSGCGVATLSISYYDLGVATGKMAVKVLTGEANISEMPVEYAPQFTKKYNKTICDALEITVPDDYVAIEE